MTPEETREYMRAWRGRQDPAVLRAERRHWRIENREKDRAAKRRWGRENAEQVHAKNLRARATNPAAYRARYLLNNAVRDGRLIRGACRTCGATERIHGHHHDYDRPLDVEWLCALCHAAHHQQEINNG